MCKCSGKCGCNITSTTKGEKGDAAIDGNSFIYFKSFETDGSQEYTAPLSGDYILMLECYIIDDEGAESLGSVTSTLTKNTVAQTNVNDYHENNDVPSSGKITHTHTAKITGVVAGNTIGFAITTPFSVLDNGSITLFKIG